MPNKLYYAVAAALMQEKLHLPLRDHVQKKILAERWAAVLQTRAEETRRCTVLKNTNIHAKAATAVTVTVAAIKQFRTTCD